MLIRVDFHSLCDRSRLRITLWCNEDDERYISEEFHESYDVEFTIDVDQKGYITQFEHTFPLERYLDLIRTQSYRVIQTNWRGQSFHVMTYSYMDEVINPNNVIFRCTNAEDVFVVAELVPEQVALWSNRTICIFTSVL